MEISIELAENILKDFQKKDISHEEKSKFIKDLLSEKNISIRELARQTNIPFSTLYDQLNLVSYNRNKNKQEFKILQSNNKNVDSFIEDKNKNKNNLDFRSLQFNNKNIDSLIERVTFLLSRDFVKTEKTIKRLEDLREEVNKVLLNIK